MGTDEVDCIYFITHDAKENWESNNLYRSLSFWFWRTTNVKVWIRHKFGFDIGT